MVVLTFDNGARASAEASFSASYGYDARAEVFGSAGMVEAGRTAATPMQLHDRSGRHAATVRNDVEMFLDAYTAEFIEFADAIRERRRPAVTGQDARRALLVALTCIESVRRGGPVDVADVERS
jgi:myo-inositol 2-dehydrogenase/D-chiro-inositol 1-dehydrogenase